MKTPSLATLALVAVLGVLAHGATAAQTAPVAAGDARAASLGTIESLDVPRYLGTWYEIAKYPNRFQRKCVGATKAEYRQQPDGTIQVINRCRLEGGGTNEAIGQARQVGPATSPKLQVRFAPAWLSFLPFVWGNYWVIDLDEAYQLAAVSEPGMEYLWILSRTPKVDPVKYNALVERLSRQGFDVRRLEVTRHD